METMKIYENFRVLASEKRAVFTADNPCSENHVKIIVRLPEEIKTFETITFSTAFDFEGWTYGMNECLVNINDEPAISFMDRNGTHRTFRLERARWYAVMKDREDDDWGYGSYDIDRAKQMCLDFENPEAYIAVIDICDNDPMCINEIEQDEF